MKKRKMKLFTMKVDEKKLLEYHNLAKSYDLPLSRLIKDFLDGQDLPKVAPIKKRKIPKADQDLIRQVAAIGNNLNQIARKVNRGEDLDLLILLQSIDQQISGLINVD